MKRRFTDDLLLDLFLEMVNKKQTPEDFCTQDLISSKEFLRLRRRFNAKHASEAKRWIEKKCTVRLGIGRKNTANSPTAKPNKQKSKILELFKKPKQTAYPTAETGRLPAITPFPTS